MKIKLVQKIPEKDGYYLMRFAKFGGLHLVVLSTELDGCRTVSFDSCFAENDSLRQQDYRIKSMFVEQLPADSRWNEDPIFCVE